MWTLVVLCSLIVSYGVRGEKWWTQPAETDQPSCRYNCGNHMGSCSCSGSCQIYGNCCYDYYYECSASTTTLPPSTTDDYFTDHQPSCHYNCGSHMGSCSCEDSCQYYGTCCYDYYYFCPASTTESVSPDYFSTESPVTEQPSCRYNCGWNLGSCSCSSSCQYYGNCCPDYYDQCSSTTEWPTTEQPSCRYNCGWNLGSCSCSSSCQYNGNCCPDYYDQCSSTTEWPTTEQPSCRYNCGWNLGSCSCSSSCQYYGNCCPDYYDQCSSTTEWPTTEQPSCRYNCGWNLGSCSCSSSCQYNGNCCPDYYDQCSSTTEWPTTEQPSCRYNCGWNLGSCSCSSSCQYNGNCCPDYYDQCSSTTEWPTTEQPSCRYNCGWSLGSCSCSSSCQYYGNCCPDYYDQCSSTTEWPTTEQPSCRYNCGWNLGSCSCSSSCQYNGNCCPDYYDQCSSTTEWPVTEQPSCRYNCGWNLGSCSCSSSCQYYGNCCPDYYDYCSTTSMGPEVTTDQPSCRYNCGSHMGICSCSSSCQYYGTCCHDYYYECSASTTTLPPSTTADNWETVNDYFTDQPSCRYNCGNHMGSCSCSGSCQIYGNCCYDYYYVCPAWTTESPDYTSCGGYLYDYSRSFSSPNYPSAYPHNADCIWYIRPGYSSIRLWFSSVNIENCGNCGCDSVSVYDGYSTSSSLLGKLCGGNTATFYSTGSYLTVRFRTDGSVTASGFRAHYEALDYFHTESPVTATPCGDYLFGAGNFTSPNHPSFYPDNVDCTWRLRASSDQRIFLTFTYLQLDNCCVCDYIKVYDGSSYMGTVCNDSLATFHSSSNSMTVVFRSDGGVVARGFKAEFISSLPTSSGQVTCSSDNMNIVVQRSYLNSLGYDGDNLYLNDQRCRPHISSSQVVFRFPIEGCGNDKKIENGRVVYTNTLWADTSSSGEITRQVHFKLNVACQMDQDSVSQIMYLAEHLGNSSIVGTGKFNTSMDFYTSSGFYYQVTQVPYKVTLNQNLYVQVDLNRQSSNLVIFLDTCVTSPSPHDFENRSYYLVRNGCPVDSTFRQYNIGLRHYARFTFKAFQFLRAAESVYIQCKVLVCPASDSNSRCHNPPNCRNRVARDLETEHDSQTLVLGPIQLRASEKKEEETTEQDEA